MDLSGRGKLRVAGEDRARFLHAMTTNHVQQLTPGTGCHAFFLTAEGQILAGCERVVPTRFFSARYRAGSLTAPILEHLDKFIIADDVTLEDLTLAFTTIAVEGPKSADVFTAARAPALETCHGANVEWGTALLARLSVTGSPRVFIILPTTEKDEILSRIGAAGAVTADEVAFRIVRLEHGKPRYCEDISERYLAQEANQPPALRFHRGCYLGQEIVGRVRSRGLLHRVLKALESMDTGRPNPGRSYRSTASSSRRSPLQPPAFGKVVALAYVRVEQAGTGTEMTAGEMRARVR